MSYTIKNFLSMAKWTNGVGLLVVALVTLQLFARVEAKSILPQQQLQQQQGSLEEKPGAFIPDMDLGGDDEGGNAMEASILNYLYTKQMLQRMRQQLELADPMKKRNYWKQCAFNAVSCFG